MDSTRDKILVVIATVTALLFWALLDVRPYPFSAGLKVIPALALALLFFFHREKAGIGLVIGLVAHAAGDAFLEIDRKALFVPGMVGFLIGHIFYIRAFLRFRIPFTDLPAQRKAAVAGVIAFACVMLFLLIPNLTGILAVAVPIYVIALIAMAVCAYMGNWTSSLLVIGATSFVVSDALISINIFLLPLGWSYYVIWPTYAAAQIFISIALVQKFSTDQA